MTQPRQILPGATYLVTRRTVLRHHLLRPDARMRELIVYALGVCAARYGVHVHGFCTMSTHIHLVVTDEGGRLPFFLAQFHRIVALATKVMRKWEGAMWDHAQTSLVRLVSPQAVIDKLGYTLANPVEAGLVRYASDWPGAKSRIDELGGGLLRAPRPSAWFDPRPGAWPEWADLRLEAPAGVGPRTVDAWREAVAASTDEHERRGRAEVEARGGHFLGARRAETVSPYERAKSVEATRERNPTFALGRVAGAFAAAARALRAFREAHRAALVAWRAGVRDIVFPLGTWWMAQAHAVVVAT